MSKSSSVLVRNSECRMCIQTRQIFVSLLAGVCLWVCVRLPISVSLFSFSLFHSLLFSLAHSLGCATVVCFTVTSYTYIYIHFIHKNNNNNNKKSRVTYTILYNCCCVIITYFNTIYGLARCTASYLAYTHTHTHARMHSYNHSHRVLSVCVCVRVVMLLLLLFVIVVAFCRT